MAYPSGLPKLPAFAQIVVPAAALHYVNGPKGVTTRAGNRIVVFGDTDGAQQSGHATFWAFWAMRNEGAPTMPFTAATWGGTNAVLNAPYLWQQPAAAGNGVVLVMTQLVGSVLTNRYSISLDEGASWGATAALPAFPDLDATQIIAPWHAIPSADGTKVYTAVYGLEAGYANPNYWSVGLYQSSDGITFTRKSWIGRGSATFGGTETAIIRLSATRLLAVIRSDHPTVLTGWTAYSDDDGATWSTPANWNGFAPNGQTGIAINDEYAFVVGRLNANATALGACAGWWLVDKWGQPSNPYQGTKGTLPAFFQGVPWHRMYRSNAGGYPVIMSEPNGLYVYDYSDLGLYQATAQVGLIKSRLILQGEPADALTALPTTDTAARTLGLVQQNRVLRDPVYDGSNNLVSANVLLYDTAAHATLDDGVTGLIGKYTLAASYTAGTNNLVKETMTEVS